jgi:hypothetical protein
MPTKTLDEEALAALERVTKARAKQREARAKAEDRAKRMIAERTMSAENSLALAVADAVAAGVPKARISREGLGTVDWDLVKQYTDRAEALGAA